MVQRKENRFQKKRRYIIITAIALAVAIVSYAVVSILINAGVFNKDNGGTTNTPPEIFEGEALYNNRGVAYPYIKSADIISVYVNSHKDRFGLVRPPLEDGKYESHFEYYYGNDNGTFSKYEPEILDYEPNTDYTSFYAIENSDGLNAYKVNYLCAAIGALYFENRIPIEEDDRLAQLSRYGLTGDSRETVNVKYIDENGEEKKVTVFIGDKLITGVGYYFMIEGRDYIYTSAASERLSYLLGDFETFLHSRIVSKGLEEDHLYEPYLTTDYKQWTNTYHSINDHDGPGTPVAKGSKVIIYSDVLTPKYESDDNTNIGDGYDRTGYGNFHIDLAEVSVRPEFDGIRRFLEGASIGELDKEVTLSVIENANKAILGLKYRYSIEEIEAVVIDGIDYSEAGYSVGSNNLVKVSYRYTVDGKEGSDELCHAIVDLSSPGIPQDVKNKIRAGRVGDRISADFDVVYSEENTSFRKVSYVVTAIRLVTQIAEDGTITYPKTVSKDSIVTVSFKYVVDDYEVGEEGTYTVNLGAITEGDELEIKNALIGKSVNYDTEIVAYTHEFACQPFMNFYAYSIKKIEGFVEKDIVVSFEFENASQRNPFYGESIYKNTLENENRYFALDAKACEKVTYLLGGVKTATDQISAGLVGTETVAVGLTAANMIKYGLYDGHTIYYELPRGIRVVDSDKNPELDDYNYLSTLGFTLYVSNPNSDGTRYIGSTMYDIIVKIDSASFDYLDKSFEDFWVRGNLSMIDVRVIDKINVELNTTELYGKYSFDLDHQDIYIGTADGQHYDEIPEGGGTKYNFITVFTKVLSDKVSESAFSKLLENVGGSTLTLDALYNSVAGKPYIIEHDTAGTANFKNILSMLYGIYYTGSMTADELNGKMTPENKMMSISFYLMGDSYGYVYDFYRVSDRRVVVHINTCDLSGKIIENSDEEVSGHYISLFAAKKIANAFGNLLNGQPVEVNAGVWGTP